VREGRGHIRARVMTCIAREGRRDVVGRLGHAGAARDVTGGAAAWRHGNMVKAHSHPCSGAMASIARLSSWRVVRRLALGDAVVMALTALVRYYADMTERSNIP
jgi:hypothetical protein